MVRKLALVAAIAACGTSSSPESAPAPATAPVVVADAAVTATATPTGVLDLELVDRGTSFVLRDAAYELTFPGRPTVASQDQKGPDGKTYAAATATLTTAANYIGFILMPIAKDVPYDAKVGLDAARDGSLNGMHATMSSDEPMTFAGLAGRKVTGQAAQQGQTFYITEYLAFDEAHHTGVMFIDVSNAANSAMGRSIVDSLVVKPGKAPPALPAQ